MVFLRSLSIDEFDLVIKSDGDGFSNYLTDLGISYHLTPLELSPRKISFIKSMCLLITEFIKIKARYIYGNNEDLSTLLALSRIATLFSVETTIHIRNPPGKFDYYKKLMFFHKNIICNSKYTKESLTRYIPFYFESKIHLIPNAHGQETVLDKEIYNPSGWVKESQPFFLTVGMINRRKAQLDVVEILEDSASAFEAKYIIIGKDNEENPYLENLEHFIEQNQLQNTVLIRPFDKELRVLYSTATATIIPSISETFGRVVIESGFYGTPVIVRDIEPLCELIEHGENGLVWDGTKGHLLELTKRLLCDTQYRDLLGNNLREKVLRDFSDQRYAQSVKNVVLRKTQ